LPPSLVTEKQQQQINFIAYSAKSVPSQKSDWVNAGYDCKTWKPGIIMHLTDSSVIFKRYQLIKVYISCHMRSGTVLSLKDMQYALAWLLS